MALPEIATPIYTLTVPSTKKKVKYRPFLVKEQKLLILALENDDQEQILDAITNTIQTCLLTKMDVKDMALFDIEYLFMQIRARSISEEVEMKVTCQDDGETTVDIKFMVDDIKVETRTVAPFATRWNIDTFGSHTIHVRVGDAAGNVARSEDVDIFVQQ